MKSAIELFVYTGLFMALFGAVVMLVMKVYIKEAAEIKDDIETLKRSRRTHARNRVMIERLQNNKHIQQC